MTWHDGQIPENEMWIKLGADHGGGTFKVMMQIANVRNPNSKHNTSLLIMAPCKDTPANIRQILRPYCQQLSTLGGMQWRSKTMRLFVFGDYDFLLKAYGLSGPQGVHPCLYCTASKSQIQMPPAFNEGNITERSLRQLRCDNSRYRKSKKKIAKLHNNAVRDPPPRD